MAVVQQSSSAAGSVRLPLKLRLKAWWQGNDLHVRRRAGAEPAAPAAEAPKPPPAFTDGWIGLVQMIWGPGHASPGDEAYVIGLVNSLGLNPAMSVLEIGGGLGGSARTMAQHFGAWVTAKVAAPELAEAGMAISIKAGMGKRAPVERYDPESLNVKEGGFDCVFAKESFYRIENKGRLLDQVDEALKVGGQLLFTDYVKPDLETGGAEPDWLDLETERPTLWAAKDYASYLRNLGYDVRVIEDISERYNQEVVKGWARCLEKLEGGSLDEDGSAMLVREVERWTRRMQALASGRLRVVRIHALKKGDPTPVSGA